MSLPNLSDEDQRVEAATTAADRAPDAAATAAAATAAAATAAADPVGRSSADAAAVPTVDRAWFGELAGGYRRELVERVLPFWLQHSQDHEHGGYFTCLDREGRVFDTDKFVWLQARQVWMFTRAWESIEADAPTKAAWLECAQRGARFLQAHGHDDNFDWYFSLRRDGTALVQPYNIFSNCFAAPAFARLGAATNNDEYVAIAARTFNRILERRENPKGRFSKAVPGTRDLKGFALPMILCNLVTEIGDLDGRSLVEQPVIEQTIEECLHEVLEVFYRPELGTVLENVASDNTFSDSFDGRLLNPGHAIEAMWFLIDLGERLKRPQLIQQAVDIALATLERGWDQQYGGIFYFLDVYGRPPQQLEWDQKLWWVHIETLVCLLKAFRHTGRSDVLAWYHRVHEYTWGHFADPQQPEWWGYLNRRGEVLLPLKGGKWKGCFHVPRGLYQCWQTAEAIAEAGAPTVADGGRPGQPPA